MSNESTKMAVLMRLGIPSIVQIDSTTAMMKLPPMWECLIDVSVPSYKWVAKSKDELFDWQTSVIVPDEIKDGIRKVATVYNDALMNLVELEELI